MKNFNPLKYMLCLSTLLWSTTGFSDVKLLPPAGNKIYFSANPGFVNEDQIVKQKITEFNNKAGKKIVWAYFSNHWVNGIHYPATGIQKIIDTGTIPFVRMMPAKFINYDVCEQILSPAYNEANLRKCDALKLPGTVYTLKKIVSGDFDRELEKWADDAKAQYNRDPKKTPLLIDFGPEMNGYWFAWGGAHQSPQDFKNAYRHIIDLFKRRGVKHVTWFFHPDLSVSHLHRAYFDPKLYYPGDDYIDWIGFSLYGAQSIHDGWKNFSDALNTNYNRFSTISATKPLAILEYAVTDFHADGTKSDWLRKTFSKFRTEGRLKAVSYWNEKAINWPGSHLEIDSSPTSLRIFRNLAANPQFVSKPVLGGAGGGGGNVFAGISPTGQVSDSIQFIWNAKAGTVNYELVYGRGNQTPVAIDLLPSDLGCAGSATCTYALPSALADGQGYYWYVAAYDSAWNLLGKIDRLNFSVSSSSPAGSGILGDYVWSDQNGNGRQDSTESGLANVTIHLQTCDGSPLTSITSANNGAYAFSNLAPGRYQMQFVLPAGHSFSSEKAAGNYRLDSNANVSTGLSPCYSVAKGQKRKAVDVGMVPGSDTADNITLKNAIYFRSSRKLWIRAVSDATPAGSSGITVSMKINGVETRLGQIGWKAAKGVYQQVFLNVAQPDSIILRSGQGGVVSGSVIIK